MSKKELALYIACGIFGITVIVFTIIAIISMQNKPVKICATSLTKDMADGLLKGYCNIDEEKMDEYILEKSVQDAYFELIDGESDIILVSDIDEETIKWLKLNNIEIESNVIAKDALVFVNNINNPIDNLTTSQLKKLYSRNKENWKDFGGNDDEIIAYPSDIVSEEEYMLKKFVGENVVVAPKYRLTDSSLESLINAASKYLDTKDRVIFYTTFRDMKNVNNEELRVLKIDDIEASENTIKNERYPATMNIYAIIRSDEPGDSQTRKFVEYIMSKEGQSIIGECGYANLVK